MGYYSETSGGGVIGDASTQVAGGAGETSHALVQRGVPSLVMADGPAGLRLERVYTLTARGEAHAAAADAAGTKYYQYATAIPIGTALAQSWNETLVFDIGVLVGHEMERFGVQIWLAPALNIHRSPLCGRNFEYYSEDPLLSGRMGAALVRGVQSHPNCAAAIKHFACNNQETNRYTSNSVLRQRALREIYLKPFEICVREARPRTVMTAYNLVNGEHASSSVELLTYVLRDEWGFDGFVMSDWFVTGIGTAPDEPAQSARYASAAGHVRAGNDVTMPGSVQDLREILAAVDNPTHAYPLTRADLQRSAMHLLAQVLALAPMKQ